MATYAQLEATKERVRTALANQHDLLDSTKLAPTQIKSVLSNMGSTYSAWVNEVDVLAAAHPNDAAVQALKASKDRLVAEFNSATIRATAMETALAGL